MRQGFRLRRLLRSRRHPGVSRARSRRVHTRRSGISCVMIELQTFLSFTLVTASPCRPKGGRRGTVKPSKFFGAWLSLVERFVRDEEVARSNRVAPKFFHPSCTLRRARETACSRNST